MKNLVKPVLKTLRGAGVVFYLVLLVSFLITLAACSIENLDLLPSGSWFAGADYLPALWVLLFSMLLACLGWMLGKKRSAWGVLSLAIVFYLCFGDYSFQAMAPQTPSESEHAFSVIALNVQYYKNGIDTVVNFLEDADADIALLSENVIPADERVYFKQRLALHHLFLGEVDGVAIISKHPFLYCHEVPFPTRQASLSGANDLRELHRNPPRTFVHALVDLNGTPVHVISVRFIAGRAANAMLAENLKWGRYLVNAQRQEEAFMRQYIARLSGPVVFGGDLNATPGSKVIRSLSRYARDAALSQHIFGGQTFRSTTPYSRLDYIFYTPPLRALEFEVVRRVVSDHFPLRAVFALNSPNAPAAWAASRQSASGE